MSEHILIYKSYVDNTKQALAFPSFSSANHALLELERARLAAGLPVDDITLIKAQ